MRMTEIERQQWLAERRFGIGGTDIVAIMGYSSYATILDVYNDKVGLSEPKPDTDVMRAGRYLEPAVAQMWADEYGFKLQIPDKLIYTHKEIPYFKASIDMLYMDSNGENGIAEIKTTQSFITEAQEQHYLQLQWYLNILEREQGHLIYLIRGFQLKQFKFYRDRELFEVMKAIGIDFWENHVIPRIYPFDMAIEVLKDKAERTDNNASEEVLEAEPVMQTLSEATNTNDLFNDILNKLN